MLNTSPISAEAFIPHAAPFAKPVMASTTTELATYFGADVLFHSLDDAVEICTHYGIDTVTIEGLNVSGEPASVTAFDDSKGELSNLVNAIKEAQAFGEELSTHPLVYPAELEEATLLLEFDIHTTTSNFAFWKHVPISEIFDYQFSAELCIDFYERTAWFNLYYGHYYDHISINLSFEKAQAFIASLKPIEPLCSSLQTYVRGREKLEIIRLRGELRNHLNRAKPNSFFFRYQPDIGDSYVSYFRILTPTVKNWTRLSADAAEDRVWGYFERCCNKLLEAQP